MTDTLAHAVVARSFLDSARIIKEDGRTSVLTGTLDRVSPPIDVFLKTIRLSGRAGALRRWLRLTPGEAQWRGLELLRSRGFAAAEPLVLFDGRDDHGQVCEVLVTRRVPGKTLLRHMHDQDLPPRAEHDLARAAGELISQMRERRIRNRDLKPSNLIVEEGAGDQGSGTSQPMRLVQIDASGIRRGHSFSNTMDMLSSLLIEPTGCACPPRLTLRLRAFLAAMPAHRGGKPLGRKMRRLVWHALERMIRDHGDPTPRVNPLEHPAES